MIKPAERPQVYNQPHCWQYDIRLKNLAQDLTEAGLTEESAGSLTTADFDLTFVPKTDTDRCKQIAEFIKRHEWLGRMPGYPTHRFVATYQGRLAGVIVMATPNAFSKILGEQNRGLEKLIGRGACISWSPKNLASYLLMWAIRWGVQNTEFRVFTAYSDPEAKELGTIYQACNFIYLGRTSGASKMYFDPTNPARGWFSNREFSYRAKYKQYARELGIEWNSAWNHRNKMFWDKMPTEVATTLKRMAKEYQARCKVRNVPPKHKYCYILGRDKRETKILKNLFETHNPDKVGLLYPKERGQ